MVGSEADDDDGDELERALGRSLDALAAEVSQPGWESMDDEVVDKREQTAEQLAEATMAMRGARQQPQALHQDRKDRGPPAGGAEGAAGNSDFRRHRRAAHTAEAHVARLRLRRGRRALGWRGQLPGAGLAPPAGAGRGAGANRGARADL